jgi:hypothetical protein
MTAADCSITIAGKSKIIGNYHKPT